MTIEVRTTHPFHMYDAMYAQPQTFAEVVERVHASAFQLAPALANARQIFLVGIGTSFHVRVGPRAPRTVGHAAGGPVVGSLGSGGQWATEPAYFGRRRSVNN